MQLKQEGKVPIIVLVGPTAIGKTEIGITIAQLLNTEIISADSMQIYRYLDIGTAKPTKKQQAQIKHYLIDMVHPDEPYNAAIYSQQAEKIAVSLYLKNKLPLVVGGTGLYIRALVDGIFAQPKIDTEWRNKFKQESDKNTSLELYNKLKQVDASAAGKVHQNDRRRIVRALEVYHYFHIPISQLQKEQRELGTQFQPYYFGLKMEMKNLYTRIDTRVERMLNQGWVDEVKQLRAQGYSSRLLSMQGLGYRQINAFLDDAIGYDLMVNFIKRDTRHYAKRQMTWFRPNPRIIWFDVETKNKEQLAKELVASIENIKKT